MLPIGDGSCCLQTHRNWVSDVQYWQEFWGFSGVSLIGFDTNECPGAKPEEEVMHWSSTLQGCCVWGGE